MKKVLFGYSAGSFFTPGKSHSISVYEMEKGFVAECWPPGLAERIDNHEPYYYMIDLSKEVIDKVLNVYTDNQELFDIKDTECDPVMDGSEYTFDFSDGNRETHIYAQNITNYVGENSKKKAEKLEKILKVFAEVAEILLEAGIEKEMLML